jgi:hypothetical protein
MEFGNGFRLSAFPLLQQGYLALGERRDRRRKAAPGLVYNHGGVILPFSALNRLFAQQPIYLKALLTVDIFSPLR